MVAAGDIIGYSDPRLKDDVRRITGALDLVQQLNGVRFVWNNRSELVAGKAGKTDIGVLANEVQAVLPELVSPIMTDGNNGETYLGVAYEKLVPVLIEAIKELNAKVERLSQGV